MANIADCMLRIPRGSEFEKQVVLLKPASEDLSCIVESEFTDNNHNTYLIRFYEKLGLRFQDIISVKKKVDNEWQDIDRNELPKRKMAEGYESEVYPDLMQSFETLKYVQQYIAFDTTQNFEDEERFKKEDGMCVVVDGNKIAELAGEPNTWCGVMDEMGASVGDEYITIEFSAKWDFPHKVEDAFAKLIEQDESQHWQGAVTEPGMVLYCNDIGNADLGLGIGYMARCPECFNCPDDRTYLDKKLVEEMTCTDGHEKVNCYAEAVVISLVDDNGNDMSFMYE